MYKNLTRFTVFDSSELARVIIITATAEKRHTETKTDYFTYHSLALFQFNEAANQVLFSK